MFIGRPGILLLERGRHLLLAFSYTMGEHPEFGVMLPAEGMQRCLSRCNFTEHVVVAGLLIP